MAKTEMEALRDAAEAADGLLTRLRRQRDTLQERIQSLEAVTLAYLKMTGKAPAKRATAAAETVVPVGDQSLRKRQPRGQVHRQVEEVLVGGEELDERSIRLLLKSRFGVDYARSTVQSALVKGMRDGKYKNNHGAWRRAG